MRRRTYDSWLNLAFFAAQCYEAETEHLWASLLTLRLLWEVRRPSLSDLSVFCALAVSGCSVSCTMLLFCLRGLTPAEAHIERSCHLQVTLKGPGYWGFTRSPLRTVKFTWAFHHLCWLPKYFRDQIIGLRRKLSGRWGMHRLSDSDKWETSMWTLVFISLPQLSLYPLACNQVW